MCVDQSVFVERHGARALLSALEHDWDRLCKSATGGMRGLRTDWKQSPQTSFDQNWDVRFAEIYVAELNARSWPGSGGSQLNCPRSIGYDSDRPQPVPRCARKRPFSPAIADGCRKLLTA
jgi:hypothetical protein